jgi:hypothetical protein
MKRIKFDNYEVQIKPIKNAKSNYNVSVTVLRDNDSILGWHERSTVRELYILKDAIERVSRSEKLKKDFANLTEEPNS